MKKNKEVKKEEEQISLGGGTTVSQYKGNPVLSLPLDAEGVRKFSFGRSKAKAVLANIGRIKLFVQKYGGK